MTTGHEEDDLLREGVGQWLSGKPASVKKWADKRRDQHRYIRFFRQFASLYGPAYDYLEGRRMVLLKCAVRVGNFWISLRRVDVPVSGRLQQSKRRSSLGS